VRHSVSTPGSSGGSGHLGATMPGDVEESAVLPAAPGDAGRSAGEHADRMLVDQYRPARGVPGVVGEGGAGSAPALVARQRKGDGVVFAGGLRDGGRAAFGGKVFGDGKAGAITAEFGEDLRGVDHAAAGQAPNQPPIGMLGPRGSDGGRELLDARHEQGEEGDQRAPAVAPSLGFRITDLPRRGRAEAGEQGGDGASARVGVLAEERCAAGR
jgi:hypothetical protein